MQTGERRTITYVVKMGQSSERNMEKMVCNIRKERDKARPSRWSWNSQNVKGREEVCSTNNH